MSARVPPVSARDLWSVLGRALREPLLHFMLAGGMVFLVHSWLTPTAGNDPQVIHVDDAALIRHLQYNDKAFAASARDRHARTLAAMSAAERETLVEAYVREEALHREALALGLDRSDYVIRRRLVQTMEYLLESAADADDSARQQSAELERYFEQHRSRYAVPSTATFTHIFFDRAAGGRDVALARARGTLSRLRNAPVPFESAPALGDRFPYFVNYVDATRDLVASHLGADFAAQVFDSGAGPMQWIGPLESSRGAHLLLLTTRADRSEPALDDVMPLVTADYRRERVGARREALVRATVSAYVVRAGQE